MEITRTAIQWAELHAPLFLSGTNLGQKLDPTKRTGLEMVYDEVQRHLYVTWNGKTSRIPEPSILSMVEGQPPMRLAKVEQPVSKMNTQAWPVNAQVSTPYGHVFQGEGHGQTGQEPAKVVQEEPEMKLPKRPGRKPKA